MVAVDENGDINAGGNRAAPGDGNGSAAFNPGGGNNDTGPPWNWPLSEYPNGLTASMELCSGNWGCGGCCCCSGC